MKHLLWLAALSLSIIADWMHRASGRIAGTADRWERRLDSQVNASPGERAVCRIIDDAEHLSVRQCQEMADYLLAVKRNIEHSGEPDHAN